MQALAVGLDPAVIDVVRNRKPLAKLDDSEGVIIQLGREIFKTHKFSSESYVRAFRALQQSNLVDVVGLMADYSRTSATLSAFNQQMPPGWKQFLPLPFTPPDDIQPDSRSRLPLIKGPYPVPAFTTLYRRTLVPAGTGPADIRRHGAGLQSLEASVGHKVIDVAILVSAREHDAQYDWTVNERKAVQDGLDPAIIDAIRNRKPLPGMREPTACLIEFGREPPGKHYISSGTYARARNAFGERDLVDLVDVMGQHSVEATLLAAFDQHLFAGQKPLLPIP